MITHATAQGTRDHQEDRYLVYEYAAGVMMAVFDGHGGDAAAVTCADLLPKLLDELYSGNFYRHAESPYLTEKDEGFSPHRTYLWIFHQLHEATAALRSGTTATMAFVPKDGRAAYMATLGDSPLVWCNGLGVSFGSEHNVRTNLAERERALARGGTYEGGYIFGPHRGSMGLQMARALGDYDLDLVLSREPDFFATNLDRDSFILVATDGVVDPSHGGGDDMQQVIDLIRQGKSAKDLVDRAIQLDTHDNATAIIWRP